MRAMAATAWQPGERMCLAVGKVLALATLAGVRRARVYYAG